MLRTRFASTLMLCFAAGCTSWHVETITPRELIADRQRTDVRVTLLGGERVVVRHPRLVGDTVRGTDVTGERRGLLVGPLLARSGPDTVIGLPVAFIQGIETRRGSAGKTLLAVGSILAVSFALVASMGCMSLNASC